MRTAMGIFLLTGTSICAVGGRTGEDTLVGNLPNARPPGERPRVEGKAAHSTTDLKFKCEVWKAHKRANLFEYRLFAEFDRNGQTERVKIGGKSSKKNGRAEVGSPETGPISQARITVARETIEELPAVRRFVWSVDAYRRDGVRNRRHHYGSGIIASSGR